VYRVIPYPVTDFRMPISRALGRRCHSCCHEVLELEKHRDLRWLRRSVAGYGGYDILAHAGKFAKEVLQPTESQSGTRKDAVVENGVVTTPKDSRRLQSHAKAAGADWARLKAGVARGPCRRSFTHAVSVNGHERQPVASHVSHDDGCAYGALDGHREPDW